ncbi:MAG: hypothetical protein LBJ69_03195 [Holosporales bacterium]|jgi:hypothetical protein|nr:hypothetical protein [Holosporales bacterium]
MNKSIIASAASIIALATMLASTTHASRRSMVQWRQDAQAREQIQGTTAAIKASHEAMGKGVVLEGDESVLNHFLRNPDLHRSIEHTLATVLQPTRGNLVRKYEEVMAFTGREYRQNPSAIPSDILRILRAARAGVRTLERALLLVNKEGELTYPERQLVEQTVFSNARRENANILRLLLEGFAREQAEEQWKALQEQEHALLNLHARKTLSDKHYFESIETTQNDIERKEHILRLLQLTATLHSHDADEVLLAAEGEGQKWRQAVVKRGELSTEQLSKEQIPQDEIDTIQQVADKLQKRWKLVTWVNECKRQIPFSIMRARARLLKTTGTPDDAQPGDANPSAREKKLNALEQVTGELYNLVLLDVSELGIGSKAREIAQALKGKIEAEGLDSDSLEKEGLGARGVDSYDWLQEELDAKLEEATNQDGPGPTETAEIVQQTISRLKTQIAELRQKNAEREAEIAADRGAPLDAQ